MDKNNKNIPIGKGTVFQTEVSFLFISPETSSRVTLASLGTVFQTEVSSCCFVIFRSLFCSICQFFTFALQESWMDVTIP